MLIISGMIVLISGAAFALVYDAYFDQQRQRLIETVTSRARLMESLASAENVRHEDAASKRFPKTHELLRAAHARFHGFGETGEFTLARREGQKIVFLLSHRHHDLTNPKPVPWNSTLAEPMRRALSGKSGIFVGLDYRGERVLAAHEPVGIINLGIVAKIDLSEIRAPFLTAGFILLGVVFLVLLAGAAFVLRVMAPILDDHELAELALMNASEGIVITNPDTTIIRVNDSYSEITGFAAKEVLGKKPSDFKSGKHSKEFYAEMWRELNKTGTWTGEIWDRAKSEETYLKMLTITAIKDVWGAVRHYVGMFHDVTRLRRVEERLQSLAFHDQLTKLANRNLFIENLQREINLAKRNEEALVLLFIDLDRFKQVNDIQGHLIGDQLLIEVANVLRKTVRSTDIVARLGGDEFAAILPGVSQPEHVIRVAQGMVDAVAQRFIIDGHELHIGCSIGIAMYPKDGTDWDTLFQNADGAMNAAKDDGKGTCRFFSEEMQETSRLRIELESGLRTALANDEFRLHYQPQIRLADGQYVGAEALVRWQRSSGELIAPDNFIPLAEESELIIGLGEWIMRTACAQAALWGYGEGDPRRMAVNVSSRQLRNDNFVSMVSKALSDSGLPPSSLEIEITETSIINSMLEATERLSQVQAMGVNIAIDDFGTGYSSLAYLQQLPVDTLKIDRSFIGAIGHDHRALALTQSIIALASHMNLETVAEGIEEEAQLQQLNRLGCRLGQGYFFSRPINPEDMGRWQADFASGNLS